MLHLYNRKKAISLILRKMYMERYLTFSRDMLEPLVSQCIDADFDYMIANDILRPDGGRGHNFYNMSNARYHILTALRNGREMTDEQIEDFIKLVEDYLDFHLSYLETIGLRYPLDEAL